MYRSLQDYIKLLESKGELIRIKEFTNPLLEIAAYTDRICKSPDGGKALLFENTGTRFPVLTNMYGSEQRMKYAIGIDSFEDISERIKEFTGELPSSKKGIVNTFKMFRLINDISKWFPVDFKGQAPCQESVQYNARLSTLPILKCNPADAGQFITMPMVNTCNPLTGARNVETVRMQIFSDTTSSIHWHAHSTGAGFLAGSSHRLPVAICLGGDPVYNYLAKTHFQEEIDKYLLAGFLRDKPVELVQCFTQDLKVPADCDFVIEGYVQKSEVKALEGAFNDYTGCISPAGMYPVFHVTCISHRMDAVYPAIVPGIPPQECQYFNPASEKIFLSTIKTVIAPEITDIHIREEGTEENIIIVKIDKRYDGQPFKVANALWGFQQMMFNKLMVIVDGDTDIRDRNSVKSAILNNYSPERDTLISRGAARDSDHSSSVGGVVGKLCIDATSHNATYSRKEISEVIQIIYDKEEQNSSDYRKLWLLGINCNPERDAAIKEGILTLDARSK